MHTRACVCVLRACLHVRVCTRAQQPLPCACGEVTLTCNPPVWVEKWPVWNQRVVIIPTAVTNFDIPACPSHHPEDYTGRWSRTHTRCEVIVSRCCACGRGSGSGRRDRTVDHRPIWHKIIKFIHDFAQVLPPNLAVGSERRQTHHHLFSQARGLCFELTEGRLQTAVK